MLMNINMKKNISNLNFIIIVVLNLLLWCGILVYVIYTNKTENRIDTLARKALIALNENPSSVKILEVSAPQRIYGKFLLTVNEEEEISEIMQSLNRTIMRNTDNFSDFDNAAQEIKDLMERYMNTITALQSMPRDNGIDYSSNDEDANKPQGWKIKVSYSAKSAHGIPYKSQYWFFFDNDGEILTRHFELPILS